MTKNREIENSGDVTRLTLTGAVLLALCIGFIGGTVYSSFKLAGDNKGQQKSSEMVQKDQSGEQESSVEVSAKILQLEQYLEKNPKDAEAWSQLGNLFFDSNQVKHAIDAYEKSLSMAPEKPGVITDLGVMYRRNNQPRKAIEAFDKAISIDPSFETARFNKGIVLLHDLNDIAGGIKAWEEIVDQNPMAMAPNGESIDSLVQRLKTQK